MCVRSCGHADMTIYWDEDKNENGYNDENECNDKDND